VKKQYGKRLRTHDFYQLTINTFFILLGGSASNWDGLNLNMTAAEMREKIGSKKKRDPRKDKSLDFRKKYEIIQTL
jgi:hypothetical protein